MHLLQPINGLVVEEEINLAKLNKSANVYGAPFAFIVCADYDTLWTRQFDGKKTKDIDDSIVTDHMMIQAEKLGLGSVWICYFKADISLKQSLRIKSEKAWNSSLFLNTYNP